MCEYRMVRLTFECAKLDLDFFLSFQSLQWTHHHDVYSGHTTMTYWIWTWNLDGTRLPNNLPGVNFLKKIPRYWFNWKFGQRFRCMFEYRMVRLTFECAKLNLDFFLSFQSLQWTHHHDVFSGHTTMTYKVYLFAVCFQCPRAAHKYRPPKALNTYPANGDRQILQFHRVMYRLYEIGGSAYLR